MFPLLAAAAILLAQCATAAEPKLVPFKETLALVGVGPGVAYYSGHGAHLGQLTASETFNPAYDPTVPGSIFATYVKQVANGDTLFGRIVPDDPLNPFTTGGVTIDGGTGRFTGASGSARYVVSVTADGVTIIQFDGKMSSVGSAK
jgi:hypothetical protein